MENFGKWVLVLAGLGFLGFGVAITAAPAAVLGGVGISGSAAGLVELRAFYGGLELGLGAFLLVCAARPAWRETGLWSVALVNGGFEAPVLPTASVSLTSAPLVPGWSTTDSLNQIELWSSGFSGVTSSVRRIGSRG